MTRMGGGELPCGTGADDEAEWNSVQSLLDQLGGCNLHVDIGFLGSDFGPHLDGDVGWSGVSEVRKRGEPLALDGCELLPEALLREPGDGQWREPQRGRDSCAFISHHEFEERGRSNPVEMEHCEWHSRMASTPARSRRVVLTVQTGVGHMHSASPAGWCLGLGLGS